MTSQSPIKFRLLRQAGQSLDDEIRFLIDDHLSGYLFCALAITTFAAFEWASTLLGMPRMPLVYTVAALVSIAFAAVQFFRVRRAVRRLRLGRDGERAVAEFLDTLRERGVKVLHDVPADGFNLDHVVISTNGVYVIQTKTRTKPGPQSRVVVDGDVVTIADRACDMKSIPQARAEARWLRDLLAESTGKTLPVRGVVVFPGWFVEQRSARGDVWVLEPKALPSFVEREPPRLSAEEVSLAAFHLKRYIRSAAELAPGFSLDADDTRQPAANSIRE